MNEHDFWVVRGDRHQRRFKFEADSEPMRERRADAIKRIERLEEGYQRWIEHVPVPGFTGIVFLARDGISEPLYDYLKSRLSAQDDWEALCWFIDKHLHRGGRPRGRKRGPAPDAEYWIACQLKPFREKQKSESGKKNVPEAETIVEIERLKDRAAKQFHVAKDKIKTHNVLNWLKSGPLLRWD